LQRSSVVFLSCMARSLTGVSAGCKRRLLFLLLLRSEGGKVGSVMKTRLFDKLLMVVAGGFFLWEIGLGQIVMQTLSSEPVSGVRVPITRLQKTSNGTSFGWLYDQGLVSNNNSSASYEEASLADADGDGFSNGSEYITGSDPKQSNSYFRVQMNGTLLSWAAVTGRVYEIQRTDRLTEAFTNAATIEYPTNTFSAAAGFYRVNVRMK
jgi:hypothetical protein